MPTIPPRELGKELDKQGSAATFGRAPLLGPSVFAGVHEMMKLDDRRVFTSRAPNVSFGEKRASEMKLQAHEAATKQQCFQSSEFNSQNPESQIRTFLPPLARINFCGLHHNLPLQRQKASRCLLLGGFAGRAASAAIWTLGANKKLVIRGPRTLLLVPSFSNRSTPAAANLPYQRIIIVLTLSRAETSTTISQCCLPRRPISQLYEAEREKKLHVIRGMERSIVRSACSVHAAQAYECTV
jgi:hypothetical protein